MEKIINRKYNQKCWNKVLVMVESKYRNNLNKTKEGAKKMKKILKNTKGITLVALVITIVLNCCGAAMV